MPKTVYKLTRNGQRFYVVAVKNVYSKLSDATKKAAELNQVSR